MKPHLVLTKSYDIF
uniref:Uncharacterized protein n=1 Tax=Rhizophora mucronata TaxID=61149 RepID=A0A2P2Q2Z2_RHIMU